MTLPSRGYTEPSEFLGVENYGFIICVQVLSYKLLTMGLGVRQLAAFLLSCGNQPLFPASPNNDLATNTT